jgi:Signal peptide peptidase
MTEATSNIATTPVTAPASQGPNYVTYFCYTTIFGVWLGSQLTLIPYVLHLLVLVTAILYVACHSSLILLEEPSEDDKANGVTSQTETLRKEDAYQFPLLGSVSLFSLYLAFKFLDKDLVNFLIGFYFCAVGCVALFATLSSLLPRKFGHVFKVKHSIRHPLPSFLAESPFVVDISMSISDVIIFVASMVFCGFYFQRKHWAMNNVLGICFCLQGIERFSLGTYKIGAILLVGLFFYDIFWV